MVVNLKGFLHWPESLRSDELAEPDIEVQIHSQMKSCQKQLLSVLKFINDREFLKLSLQKEKKA
jgi:hypothetical protein